MDWKQPTENYHYLYRVLYIHSPHFIGFPVHNISVLIQSQNSPSVISSSCFQRKTSDKPLHQECANDISSEIGSSSLSPSVSASEPPTYYRLSLCQVPCSHPKKKSFSSLFKTKWFMLETSHLFWVLEVCSRGFQGHWSIFMSHFVRVVLRPEKMIHYELKCETYHICVRHWTKTGHINVSLHFCYSVCEDKEWNSL